MAGDDGQSRHHEAPRSEQTTLHYLVFQYCKSANSFVPINLSQNNPGES